MYSELGVQPSGYAVASSQLKVIALHEIPQPAIKLGAKLMKSFSIDANSMVSVNTAAEHSLHLL